MQIGIIGCGFAFDRYMETWGKHPRLEIAGVTDLNRARVDAVSRFYKIRAYDGNEAMLADPEVDIVANFTSIKSHYQVIKAALEAGKHVYSEKPLTTDLNQARELFALAEARGLYLSCAPSNALGDTSQTIWKAVEDGAVGDVRIVYAEFDDNLIYLMSPEHLRSRTGAPWPYLHEYEMGCTWEHVGYHLTWMCAIFGPVESVTAFSKCTIPDKTDQPLNPPDTPDFSVACLNFQSGIVGRVTCSIGAPYDHRMRIIGNKGMLTADTYFNYQCPVYLEHFTKLSLKARRSITVRHNTFLQRLFGVGGRPLKLVRNVPPGADRIIDTGGPYWTPKAWLNWIQRHEVGQQDKCLGIAELADAIRTGRQPFPPHDFIYHLTELTLAIQGAGTKSQTHVLESRFKPVTLPERTRKNAPNYLEAAQPRWINRFAGGVFDRIRSFRTV
jgi:predicted dehydrogenase